jgi:hypothetical protein
MRKRGALAEMGNDVARSGLENAIKPEKIKEPLNALHGHALRELRR